jgi:uncharacterized protein (DUF885 family)
LAGSWLVNRRTTLTLSVAALLVAAGAVPQAFPQSSPYSRQNPTAERVVTRLADEYVRETIAAYPEYAFLNGFSLPRHDGLSDNSTAAYRAWEKKEDRWWKEVSAIDPTSLWGKPEWITYGFLRERLESSRESRVCRNELWPVNQLSGWQAKFTALAEAQPVGTAELRDQALARWSKLPRYLDNEISRMREGLKLGYSTPRHNVQLSIEQLELVLNSPLGDSPFFSPAQRDSAPGFRAAWERLLGDKLSPAIRRYADFLRAEYLPRARSAIAISAEPDGAACYQASFRAVTSLDRPPRETYAKGEARVAQHESEMARIGREALGTSDVAALRARVDTDTANRFHSREEMLAFTRDAVARAKGALPKWFGRLPKAAAEVRPQPEFLEANAPDQYDSPAQDGSRPGVYRINLYQPEKKLRSKTEVTAFHEIYPGHHLQIALAQEQPAVHPISQLVGTGAFVEGWGRYAEQLAEEMGLYTSPLARLGRRSWPGHGMVVDPGLHLLGWSRDSAINYVRNGGWPEAEAMVDRVVVWPAQLTAYDTGALEIIALRDQAKRDLGDRFDIREFHDQVLANGAITLPMLRQVIEHWLASKKN